MATLYNDIQEALPLRRKQRLTYVVKVSPGLEC